MKHIPITAVVHSCIAGAARVSILLAIMLSGGACSRAEKDPGEVPDRMLYYEENMEYTHPEVDGGVIAQETNTWVKRSPLSGGPPSPKLGYEASMDYHTALGKLIRHGGHNQGGGGEQGFETWVYDLVTGKWTLMYPNTSPPGNCCSRTNVIHHASGKFIRFPGFSGNHGWQWTRRILNMDSSVWAYDLRENRWTNMRPFPEVPVGPARAAAYDADNEIILVFNVHGPSRTAAYDLYTNTWTALYPQNEPPPKTSYTPGMSMAYDRSEKLFVLFGAGNGTEPGTFIYDIRENVWKETSPSPSPPYDKSDPVMAYDCRNNVTVCVAANKEKERLETWLYYAGEGAWRKAAPAAEPDTTRDRQRMLAYSPDQNLVILENRWSPGGWRDNEQQIWTYRYADPPPADNIPTPPARLYLETDETGIRLSWETVPGADGYNIYHGTGDKPWLVSYQKTASTGSNMFHHTDIEKGAVHYYYVTSLAGGRESPPGLKARSQPRLITDIVVSPVSKDQVEIEWRGGEEDTAGYNLYRAPTNVRRERAGFNITGPFEAVNSEIIRETKFTDNVALSSVYAYRVHAVNALGVESGPSPYVLTIPSPPEHVYSKEDGHNCLLRWRENPEKSVSGYNIYRTGASKFDDRHDLVNKEPVKETTFTDIGAARGMPKKPANTGRRYYITAVDFLGQESFPSAPVWFYREWRRFYTTEEWHQ